MFNIGFPEFAIIFMAALLLLGPKKLPEFARWAGRALREFREATQDVRTALDLELEREEFERIQQEFQSSIDPSLFDPLAASGEPSDYAYAVPDEESGEFDPTDRRETPDWASHSTAEDSPLCAPQPSEEAPEAAPLPDPTESPPGTVAHSDNHAPDDTSASPQAGPAKQSDDDALPTQEPPAVDDPSHDDAIS